LVILLSCDTEESHSAGSITIKFAKMRHIHVAQILIIIICAVVQYTGKFSHSIVMGLKKGNFDFSIIAGNFFRKNVKIGRAL
jgi:hypothetical protein